MSSLALILKHHACLSINTLPWFKIVLSQANSRLYVHSAYYTNNLPLWLSWRQIMNFRSWYLQITFSNQKQNQSKIYVLEYPLRLVVMPQFIVNSKHYQNSKFLFIKPTIMKNIRASKRSINYEWKYDNLISLSIISPKEWINVPRDNTYKNRARTME